MTSNKANDKQKTSCDGACLRTAGQKMYAKKNSVPLGGACRQ